MTLITGTLTDLAGAPDSTAVEFYTTLRESDDGNSVITTKRVRRNPVAGVLSVALDPGFAVVAYKGLTYNVTVPDSGPVDFWDLIEAAVTIPPSTMHQQLVDAVDAWLEGQLVDELDAAAASAITAAIAGRSMLEVQTFDIDGWQLLLLDPENREAFGIDDAGDFYVKLRSDALLPDGRRFGDVLYMESGEAVDLVQVLDPDNRFALIVDFAGDTTIAGFTTETQALIRSIVGTSLLTSAAPIYTVGDSLTAAADWQAQLSTSLGVAVTVDGIGSQTSDRIAARQGGQPALVTLASDTIATSGAVSVTSISPPLLTRTPDEDRTMVGSIAGVEGTLAHVAIGDTYTFTRTVSGTAVYVPPRTPFIPKSSAAARQNHQIIWAGRNDYTSQATVLANVAAMVKYLSARPYFLVLEIPPSSTETTGSGDRTTLDATNAALQAAYPHQFVPVATYLRSAQAATDAGVTFNGTDTTDIANGVTPTVFRADALHLNSTGQISVGKFLARTIIQKGWPLT